MPRIVTYNVHRCVGTDRRLDVGRIAAVLAELEPDIVALQELDVGRARTGGVDQAHEIARRLDMACHFHAALKVEEELYVRRPTEAQSWLAEGALHADHDPAQWFDRDIANIEHGRIASVTITHGDKKLVFGREGDKLVLKDPAEHPKLEDYKLEDIGRAFELLTFQDVRPASDPIGATVGTAVFTTSDGLILTATVFKADKDIWVGMTATGTDKAEAEGATLSKRVSGWLYQLGSWKEKALVPEIDDLKAAEKPAEPPAPAAKP